MDSRPNLVLTGFMGTGKTTVGRVLAERLGMDFVDTDELIESRHGPIAGIFADQGEAGFRSIERGVARELGERSGLVIATGGRMVLEPENRDALSENGRIFCLVATPDQIYDRVVNDESRRDRPLLQVDDPRQRIDELLAERRAEYAQFRQVTTGHASPEEIADEIVEMWSE